MIIDNVRIPVWIEQGAKGGPMFNTQINRSQGGSDTSIILWQYPLHMYDIGYGISQKSEFSTILDFFYARRGRGYGFRFKDWSDFEITAQQIGVGNGVLTTFQITKTYSDAVRSFSRKITRIEAGTALVYVNGVLRTLTTHYTINNDTGLITFQPGFIPAAAALVTVTCSFDVPVRFDNDRLDVELQVFDSGMINGIILSEVRE